MSQGLCEFTGLAATRGWDFTFGPGVTPSVCVITTLENRSINIGTTGTLKLSQDGYDITFPNCRVANRPITGGRGGRFVKLAIEDRRWRWQFSQIDGSYNIRKSESNILRKKTPQELATLLFEALGETDFDVSELPDGPDVWPEANWQGVPAAPLLSNLCAALGCFVVLVPGTNKARIAKIGTGAQLPSGGKVIRRSSATVIQAVPDEVRFVTGPTLFQIPFELEAVGVDTDGKIVPIDDLSYKPSAGWGNTDPDGFYSVSGTHQWEGETVKNRDLAQATVFRMYRVQSIWQGLSGEKKLSLPILDGTDYETSKLLDFLPLRNTRIDTFIDQDGEEKEKPYDVWGSYAKPKDQAVFNDEDNEEFKRVPQSWHILDGARGIVNFSLPMFFFGADNEVKPAYLVLETSFNVNNDGIFVRHEEFRPMVSQGEELGTGPYLIRRNDLRRKIIESPVAAPVDNEEDIKKEADYYIEQWRRTLQANTSQSILYSRLVQWNIDGITLQITWSGGGGRPCTTQISQGSEHNPYVPSWKKKTEEIETKRIAKEAEFMQGFNAEIFK